MIILAYHSAAEQEAAPFPFLLPQTLIQNLHTFDDEVLFQGSLAVAF
jgi:hypothetical protein